MKQVTLCIFGDGYTEPSNCEIDLALEDRTLIPSIGDVVNLSRDEGSTGCKESQFSLQRGENADNF